MIAVCIIMIVVARIIIIVIIVGIMSEFVVHCCRIVMDCVSVVVCRVRATN